MHQERLRSSTPTVYLACENREMESGETAPPSGLRSQNPARSHQDRHTNIVRINDGGGALIYNAANQIIKYETQELQPFLILLFICNQGRKPRMPKDLMK